jgi:hypothetical protein
MRYGRNTRTAAGAYEGAGSSSYNAGYSSTTGGARGFEHLDEEDAWDTRVGGYNPYEEERELGLVGPHHDPPAAGGRPDGEGYQMNLPVEPEEERRGRTRSRSPAPAAHAHAQQRGELNPFDDEAEPSNLSLRGVSPRPMEGGNASFAARKAADGDHDRRSIFREDV